MFYLSADYNLLCLYIDRDTYNPSFFCCQNMIELLSYFIQFILLFNFTCFLNNILVVSETWEILGAFEEEADAFETYEFCRNCFNTDSGKWATLC